ncbi:transcriptional activator SPT7 [Kluyveromyces marxianus DMKU3-1042]|uniref:SAGA complex subunit Spt7 n=1 Tax=Kluyveromyces marxianus (strain DMKU3-1042 / BCC 29191 / NBRC 104275) TaxID=1003335 RepID=W0TJ78_KLUMD|nr:transcriptional activator SPT7 [Kluyveromyces marxianus DMKU3-1042]BAO42214.1 transcriptional activator SPT7 [Kluyveromyces marxianus DMKU3-1042]
MLTDYQRSDAASILPTVERLFAEGVFKKYLNPSQLLLLKSLLHLRDSELKARIWDSFLTGKLELFVKLQTKKTGQGSSDGAAVVGGSTGQDSETAAGGSSGNGNGNGDDDDAENDLIDLEQLKAQLEGLDFIGNLSLKVRYVVWEHGLEDLQQQGPLDYLLLEEKGRGESGPDEKLDNDVQMTDDGAADKPADGPANGPAGEPAVAPVTTTSRAAAAPVDEEDDNYDDDEDDDDDDEDNYDDAEEDPQNVTMTNDQPIGGDSSTDSTAQTKPSEEEQKTNSVDEGDSATSPTYEVLDNGIIKLHITITKDTLNELPSVNPYDIIGNFHKIYHLFDNDKETVMRRLKLQENDQMLENSRKRSHDQIEGEEEEDDSGNPSIAHPKSSSDTKSKPKGKNDIQMDLGVVNLSLRHLLKSVQENKSKLDISDYELKHLIMDVRMNRSKWASDDKIGQEELYDACEKVVLELRNYTEHSTAFLNKVSKREAPNYDQIIKKPMDLNRVLKKLKTFQYKSKHEFVDDIMLIWRNCLTYNSDPKHFLRAHAIAMQKKSQQLIPLIPDITIRDRAQVEKELEEADADSNVKEEEEDAGSGRKGIQRRGVQKVIDDEEDDSQEVQSRGKKAKPSDTPNKKPASSGTEGTKTGSTSETEAKKSPTKQADSGNKEEQEEGAGGEGASSKPSSEQTDSENNKESVQTAAQNTSSATDNNAAEEEEDEEDEEDNTTGMMLLESDDDKDDLELSTWKTLTAKARAEICLKRSQLFTERKINAETDALLKNPSKLKHFDQFFEEYKQQKEAEFARQKLQEQSIMKNGFGAVMNQSDNALGNGASDSNFKSHSTESAIAKESNEITAEEVPLLTEYNVTNYVPDLAYEGVGKEQLDALEENMVQKIVKEGTTMKSKLMNNIDKGLGPKMNHNIQLIHEIRHICHKISLIRALQNPNKPKTPPQPQRFKEFIINDDIDLDPISQLASHDYKSDEKLINRVLHRNVSKIAMSNGFESTEPTALNMLSEITADYLSNLIKTIKLHHETHSTNKRKPIDALNMTLLENGINKPDDLFTYMENEFGKKTRKLEDLKGKLSSFLKDLLRPALQDINERNFDDESQSFLTGDFSSEVTGEDFFGFKELGLEKEFGDLAGNVPLQLLTFQFSGKDADIQVKTKVIQPEEFEDVIYKKVTRETVQSGTYSKLIQPLLQSAVDRCTAYFAKLARSKNANQVPKNYDSLSFPLLEDEEYPKVKGSNRPRLPPTGKISTNYKKKHVSELFVLPEEEEKEEPKEEMEADKGVGSNKNDVSGIKETKDGVDDIFKAPMPIDENGFNIEETPMSSFSLNLPGMPDN